MPPEAWLLHEQWGEKDRSSLPEIQRCTLAICDLRQEVGSGGFDSYFRYWGGNTAPEALAALAKVLGDEWDALLREAMAALGPAYPGDPDARADIIDQHHLDERLSRLDDRFYELEGSSDADRRVDTYLAGGGS